MSSKATVVPFDPSLATGVRDLLAPLSERTPSIQSRHFNSILACPWGNLNRPTGNVLIANQKPVGFLSTLYSERTIDGRTHRFCNLNTWIVEPEYRQHSLALLFPILKDKEISITNLTPSEKVQQMLKHFGFQNLETSLTAIFPSVFRPLPRPSDLMDVCRLLAQPSVIDLQLNGLIEDHQQTQAKALSLSIADESCTIFFAKTSYYRFNYSLLLSISNPVFFNRHLHAFRAKLFSINGTLRILTDTRFLGGLTPHSSKHFPNKRLIRPAAGAPSSIDNLYSELVLLPDY